MAIQLLETRPLAPDHSARIRFRQPVSTGGYIDAAWWPRSLDLTAELPPLLDVMWNAGREISRVFYPLPVWDPAPRQLRIGARTIRLGGFTIADRLTVMLTDSWGRERIDVLVIPPDTDPAVARRALELAGEAGNPYHAGEILQRALGSETLPSAA